MSDWTTYRRRHDRRRLGALRRWRASTDSPGQGPPPLRIDLQDIPWSGSLTGRRIEDVRIVGNTEVSTAIILNLVRTRVGEKFDPVTAQEDYQRIYGLRKFSMLKRRSNPQQPAA